MASYTIYKKNGTALLSVKRFEFNETLMGECNISMEVESPTPIDWEVGCYMTYRNETFTMGALPSVEKVARSGSYGGAFKYTNVILHSRAEELRNCMFLDYVLSDNKIHYTSLPNFSFYFSDEYPENITGMNLDYPIGLQQFADRLVANLERTYGEETWVVEIAEGTRIIGQSMSFNSKSCWDALCDVCNELDLTFYVRNRYILIGSSTNTLVDTQLLYGKDNGLVSIERASDENQQVVTRLYAYGNTRNIPHDYYRALSRSGSMYVPNLMLPMFRETGYDAYVDSDNISTLGIREAVKFFDGSDSDVDDIYPSIEGMTTKLIYDSMTPAERETENISMSYDQGSVDEIVDATDVDGDGNIPEEQQSTPTFKVIIKNIGFNINDQKVTGDTPRMSMKSGTCAGREFEILSVEKKTGADVGGISGATYYQLTCAVEQDDSINQYFPNGNFQLHTGDKFVLLGIAMPDLYVKVAENRLLIAAKDWLSENDHTAYTFTPNVNNIWLASDRYGVIVAQSLRAGLPLNIVDTDLGIDETIIVSSLKIKVGSAQIDEYEITLSNDTDADLASRINNAVSNGITNYFVTGGGSTYTTSSILNKYFELLYDTDGRPYLRCKIDLASAYGMTAYTTTLAEVNSIMAGVLVDNETITKVNNKLVVIGGGGGGGSTFVLNVTTTGSGNALTAVNYDGGGNLEFTKGATYITQSALTGYVTITRFNNTLANYATTSAMNSALANYVTSSALSDTLANYVTSEGLNATLGDYVTNSALTSTLGGYVTTAVFERTMQNYVTTTSLNSTLTNYVTRTTAQTISGIKTFTNGIRIGDAVLEWDSANKALKITNKTTGEVANLLVSGGGTFYNE